MGPLNVAAWLVSVGYTRPTEDVLFHFWETRCHWKEDSDCNYISTVTVFLQASVVAPWIMGYPDTPSACCFPCGGNSCRSMCLGRSDQLATQPWLGGTRPSYMILLQEAYCFHRVGWRHVRQIKTSCSLCSGVDHGIGQSFQYPLLLKTYKKSDVQLSQYVSGGGDTFGCVLSPHFPLAALAAIFTTNNPVLHAGRGSSSQGTQHQFGGMSCQQKWSVL